MLAIVKRDRMSSSCMQYAADGLRAACSQRHVPKGMRQDRTARCMPAAPWGADVCVIVCCVLAGGRPWRPDVAIRSVLLAARGSRAAAAAPLRVLLPQRCRVHLLQPRRLLLLVAWVRSLCTVQAMRTTVRNSE